VQLQLDSDQFAATAEERVASPQVGLLSATMAGGKAAVLPATGASL
jgi:hypothetical protein